MENGRANGSSRLAKFIPSKVEGLARTIFGSCDDVEIIRRVYDTARSKQYFPRGSASGRKPASA